MPKCAFPPEEKGRGQERGGAKKGEGPRKGRGREVPQGERNWENAVKWISTSKVSTRTSLVEQLRRGVGKQTLLLYCHSSC